MSKCWRPYRCINVRVSCWKYITTFWSLMPLTYTPIEIVFSYMMRVKKKKRTIFFFAWWINSGRSCISWKLPNWMGRENAQDLMNGKKYHFSFCQLHQRKTYFRSLFHLYKTHIELFVRFVLLILSILCIEDVYFQHLCIDDDYWEFANSLKIVQYMKTAWNIVCRSSIVNILIRTEWKKKCIYVQHQKSVRSLTYRAKVWDLINIFPYISFMFAVCSNWKCANGKSIFRKRKMMSIYLFHFVSLPAHYTYSFIYSSHTHIYSWQPFHYCLCVCVCSFVCALSRRSFECHWDQQNLPKFYRTHSIIVNLESEWARKSEQISDNFLALSIWIQHVIYIHFLCHTFIHCGVWCSFG